MARTRLYPPSVDPGFPELPPTPEGWNRTTFQEVCEVVERPVKLDPDTNYRLLTAKRSRGGITLRGELSGREILTKTQFEAKAGDFLISRRQIIHGACGVVPPELDGAIVSNEYSTLRTRPGLLSEFLLHYSHTPYFQRTCFHSSHGVDVEKMIFKIDEWLARAVDVPPKGEQKKIADILSSVDAVIDSSQAVINQLQVVKKSTMAELLTRGIPGRHTKFKMTEIGEVPEEWEMVLGEHLFTLAGGYGPTDLLFCQEGSAIFLKVDDFNLPENRRGLHKSALRFEPKANSRVKTYPAKSLVFPKRGAAIFKNRVQILLAPATVDPNLMILLPGPRLDPIFFAYEMIHIGLYNLSDNSGIPQINNKHLYPYMFLVPSMDEQRAIRNIIESIDDRIDQEIEVGSAFKELKQSLMSVLLSGEVRVESTEDLS